MFKLAAFADEIDPNPDVQIEHCLKNGVRYIELRSAIGLNVLDFPRPFQEEFKRKLDDVGMGVCCIGSPIGKVKLDQPFGLHLDRFRIALDMAEFFGAPFIRIFSYYPAEGSTRAELVARFRDEVIRRMQQKLDCMRGSKVVLVHENEANIYGETGADCADLHRALPSLQFRAAFDSANFIMGGEDPGVNWPLLKPYVAHFHIKDAVAATKTMVPAGCGDARIGEILQDAYASGYHGFLTLEPHLRATGQFSGFSGSDLFAKAADALKGVLKARELPFG